MGRTVALLLLAGVLTGCTRLRVPPATTVSVPLPERYRGAPQTEAETVAKAEAVPSDDPARWWARLGDPTLTEIVAAALETGADPQTASARLLAARADVANARAALRPALDMATTVRRERRSLEDPFAGGLTQIGSIPRDTTTLNRQADVTWELDLFDRLGARRDASALRLDASAAGVAAVRLALAADVALHYVDARGLQAELALARTAAELAGELAQVAEARQRGGQTSAADVLRAEASGQEARLTIAALEGQLAASVSALATLAGVTPARVEGWLEAPASLQPRATSVAAGVPSDLLRRRPDVIEAERRLAAAARDLAATSKDRFPRLVLGGSVGSVAASLSNWAGARAITSLLAPRLSMNSLDFGRLQAEVDRLSAAEQEAAAVYRQSIVRAFAEAETSLQDLPRQQRALVVAAAAVRAQSSAWEIVQRQYEAGITDLTSALEARQSLNRYEVLEARTSTAALRALVHAYKALGGGW